MKIVLVSFLSLFLSFFKPLSNPIYDENKTTFVSNCEKGYDTYRKVHEEETINYKLLIIEGEYNEEITYSIMFISSTPNEYDLAIQKNDIQKYNYPQENSRGDVFLYNYKVSSSIKVVVQTKGVDTFSYEVVKPSLEVYKIQLDLIMGQNNGFENEESKKPLTTTLSIIFLIIILISIIVILVLYTTKKGLFNQERLDKEFEEQHQRRDEINNIIKEQETVEVQAEEVIEQKEVYEKVKFIDDEEVRDISILLKEKGFNTNYNTLLTHEKNEIMLELMKMKDFKEITEEEYKQEIIKLWM